MAMKSPESPQTPAQETCTWVWARDGEHDGFWTAQCKEDWPIQMLHEGAMFCPFCGRGLIVEGED